MWSLTGGGSEPQITDFFMGIFKQGAGAVTAAPWSSLNLIVGVSCQELPAIHSRAATADRAARLLQPEARHAARRPRPPRLPAEGRAPRVPLEGDAGVLHAAARVLSLSRPPFLLSYQGVLFRRYPEGYQTLLDRGSGQGRAVKVESLRPALGTFKAQLTEALKVSDDTAQSALSQTGFKQSTWWGGSDKASTSQRTGASKHILLP